MNCPRCGRRTIRDGTGRWCLVCGTPSLLSPADIARLQAERAGQRAESVSATQRDRRRDPKPSKNLRHLRAPDARAQPTNFCVMPESIRKDLLR
jgi:hypothetical protein